MNFDLFRTKDNLVRIFVMSTFLIRAKFTRRKRSICICAIDTHINCSENTLQIQKDMQYCICQDFLVSPCLSKIYINICVYAILSFNSIN